MYFGATLFCLKPEFHQIERQISLIYRMFFISFVGLGIFDEENASRNIRLQR